MNMKKIIAAMAAAAMAVTMTAVSAFAATVTLDSEYVGAWGAGACIPKTELEAIGGDVKVTLDIETRNLAGTADQFLIAPMDFDNSWTRITDKLTTNAGVAKGDGFVVINETQTTQEFVVPADVIATLGDSGLGFQVQNVIIKSATLEAGSAEGEFIIIEDADTATYCFGDYYYEAVGGAEATEEVAETEAAPAAEATEEVAETEAAPAAEVVETEAAPVADATTTAATTGNTAAATIAIVMVAAGAAALISKRK